MELVVRTRPPSLKAPTLPAFDSLGKGCSLNTADSRKVLNDLVLKHIDSGRNIHVLQYRLLHEIHDSSHAGPL